MFNGRRQPRRGGREQDSAGASPVGLCKRFELRYRDLWCDMQKLLFVFFALAAISMAAHTESRPTRFWNLTLYAISALHLAPSGTESWGTNQCNNDKDGTVDPDERLRITGVDPGTYDAKLTDVSGRSCLVRNIEVRAGEIFSIEEKDLISCSR
jgi:hypothetical protein